VTTKHLTSESKSRSINIVRKAGVRFSDKALRFSGLFRVKVATPPSIEQSSSEVPVSIIRGAMVFHSSSINVWNRRISRLAVKLQKLKYAA
jgi:hypothetical protein